MDDCSMKIACMEWMTWSWHERRLTWGWMIDAMCILVGIDSMDGSFQFVWFQVWGYPMHSPQVLQLVS